MANFLIAYFSLSGRTRQAAERIAKSVGGDLFEIKTSERYPDDYHDVIEAAKKETELDARPALMGELPDVSRYDAIVVGFPNWCSSCPKAVLTFLETYDLSGMRVLPFMTHGGGGIGKTNEDIANSCPGAIVSHCFDANELSDESIADWLK